MSETQAPGGGTIRGDDNLNEDARQLEALGYKSHFSRTMSLAANFSLGFTYLSPLVGVYTLFAFVVAIGGAAAIWTYPIAMAGQLLVALIFAEVLSQYPIVGGPYPWALRLWGRHYAWITGWVYAWALLITIAGSPTAQGSSPPSSSAWRPLRVGISWWHWLCSPSLLASTSPAPGTSRAR
jgi:amino acid transporter